MKVWNRSFFCRYLDPQFVYQISAPQNYMFLVVKGDKFHTLGGYFFFGKIHSFKILVCFWIDWEFPSEVWAFDSQGHGLRFTSDITYVACSKVWMLQLSANIMRDFNQYYPGNSAGDHFRTVKKYDPKPKDVGDLKFCRDKGSPIESAVIMFFKQYVLNFLFWFTQKTVDFLCFSQKASCYFLPKSIRRVDPIWLIQWFSTDRTMVITIVYHHVGAYVLPFWSILSKSKLLKRKNIASCTRLRPRFKNHQSKVAFFFSPKKNGALNHGNLRGPLQCHPARK